jgi:hypothetical protein
MFFAVLTRYTGSNHNANTGSPEMNVHTLRRGAPPRARGRPRAGLRALPACH